MDNLFPFDPEDPKYLNQGIWECSEVMPNCRHITVLVRASTNKYEQNSSIVNQLEDAREFSYTHRCQVTRIIVVRQSGLKLDRNPVHKKFLSFGYNGTLDIIFVKELSRLTRRAKDMIQYVQDFFMRNIRIVSISDEFDTDNQDWYGKLLDLAAQYEKESKRISDRQKRAKRAKASRGEYLGSEAPYGLEKVGKTLRIASDSSAEVVREIFRSIIEGKSPSEIARIFTERKVMTPSQRLHRKNASNHWHDTQVRKLLTNPVYCGHFQGPQSHVIFLGETKRKMVPSNERTLNENKMEPLVDKVMYETVQRMLKERTRGKDGRALNQCHKDEPLIDVLYCSDCGHQMHRVPRSWGKEHYACATHLKKGKGSCTGRHSVYRSSLLQAVADDIQLLLSNTEMEGIVLELTRKAESERIRLLREVRQMQARIASVENSILEIELAKVENRITDFVAEQLISRKEAEKLSMVERKQNCEELVFLFSVQETPESILQYLHKIDIYILIRTLVSRIEIGVDGEITRIVYNIAPECKMNIMAA